MATGAGAQAALGNQTFFQSLKKSFVSVPVDQANDNAIPTSDFLEASESLTTLFDLLGSTAFRPVKSDMTGNINKIRARQLASPAQSETLQSLVINEIKGKQHNAAEGLLWLVRGLDFTAQALRLNLKNPSEELSASFRTSYGNTLKPLHSFIVKPLFSAAMSATPYRKDFYARLGSDQAAIDTQMNDFVTALEKQVAILKDFQARKEAKW